MNHISRGAPLNMPIFLISKKLVIQREFLAVPAHFTTGVIDPARSSLSLFRRSAITIGNIASISS